MWGSILAAGLAHAAIFQFTPQMEVPVLAADLEVPAQLLRVSALFEAELPPSSPEAVIPVPALPTVEDLNLDFSMEPSIPMPDFEDLSVLSQVLVPTLETTRDEWLDFQNFAPMVVRPEIRNRTELRKFLERHYQPILEFSGATGVVQVFFWIDESGLVQKAEIARSSGSRSLDRLAMRLSKVLRFRPAMLAGRPVRVQVRVPITFRAA